MKTWLLPIAKLGACSAALKWAEAYDSLEAAWAACERGDQMLWLAGQLSGGPGSHRRKTLALASCECARLSLKYVSEERGMKLLQMVALTEAWVAGEVPLSQVRESVDQFSYSDFTGFAAHTAYASTSDTASYASAAASTSASYAVYIASASASAYYASEAVSASATSPDAYASPELLAVLGTCADIVRKHYPAPPVMEATR